MNDLAAALPWVAFWAVIGLLVWVQHNQYMAGHDTGLFEHKTQAEIRLRDAAVRKLEAEAELAEQRVRLANTGEAR